MKRLSAAAIAAVALGLVVSAQQAPPPQTPVFRSSVDLVHLDVSVLDRNRKPVRGLTEKDFTVYEDGTPQAITVFSAVDVPEVPPPPAPWVQSIPHEIQTNQGAQQTDGRLFVLLMDDALMPMQPAFLANARGIAKRVLDKVTPADRVAVVFSAAGRNQNFTSDRAKLLAAIDTFQTGHASHLRGWDLAVELPAPSLRGGAPSALADEPKGPIIDPDIPLRSASMETLRLVAETLINAPQRRKILVWVSPGISIDDASAARLEKGATDRRQSMRDANQALLRNVPELFLRMQRANVTIYPIDPCGLDGLNGFILQGALGAPALRPFSIQTVDNPDTPPQVLPGSGYDWLSSSSPPPPPIALAQHMSSISLSFLEAAARNTGGVAVINTNDFEAGVNRVFEENGSYYLLGYPQPQGLAPGTMHRLKVEVNRPDVTVRTRSGYFTEEAPKRGRKEPSPLDKAIMGPVPEDAFPMRAAIAVFAVPGKKDPIVTIALGLEQPGVTARTSYEVEVQTNAYTSDGRPKFVGRRDAAKVVLVPKPGVDRARYDLLQQISLQPGRYEVRVSAVRPTDNVRGSLYADVEVPDFTKDPLSVSGLVVQLDPPGATAPPSAFGTLLPVTPTSNREFRRTDLVSVFFRVYQGGKDSLDPAGVNIRIVNDKDVEVGKGRQVIPIDQFHGGGRTADFSAPVPVESLPPGRYLATFEVLLRDHRVTRVMQFSMVK